MGEKKGIKNIGTGRSETINNVWMMGLGIKKVWCSDVMLWGINLGLRCLLRT